MAENTKITEQEIQEMYFLKSTKVIDHYLHYKGKNTSGDGMYELCEGQKGAAIWDEESGRAFILACGFIGHLELVKLLDVVNK